MTTIGGNLDINELEHFFGNQSIQFNETLDLSNNNLPYLRTIFPPHFRNLSTLKLTDCKIVTIAPTAFKLLDNLQHLNLNNNQIASIPSNLFECCIQLSRLSFRNNRLTAFKFTVFAQIPRLTELDLSGNLIRRVTGTSFAHLKILNLANNLIHTFSGNTYDRLAMLNLHSNRLRKLTASLTRNSPCLIDFDASRNEIATIAATTFKYAPQLQSLRLNSNRLVRFTTDLLSDTSGLTSLELNDNRIDCLDLKRDRCSRLETLRFARNPTLNYASLENLPNLKLLDLEQCSFKLRELPPLDRLRHLENLNFSQNYFLMVPPTYFHRLRHLQLLLLDNSYSISDRNGNESLMAIDNSLVRLSMSYSNMVEVRQCFRYLFRLTHLNLAYNRIVRLPSGCFKDLNSLEYLYLNSNELQFIDLHTFRFMLRLKMCDLRVNRLETLNRRLFETTVMLEELYYDRQVRFVD